MGEMVLDGGGQFIPAVIVGLYTLSLFLVSFVAHDHAKEDAHTHTGKERKRTRDTCTINVGTVHKPKQGGINSVPLRVTHRY